MTYDITPAFVSAFTARVEKLGYTVTKQRENSVRLAVLWQNDEVCLIEESGDFLYRSNCPCCIKALFFEMKEAHTLYANAKPLECDGVTDFRLISEFGNVLLAAKLGKDNEVHFNTWSYTYDHKDVVMGHYYETHYEEAKRDFAIRAGLIRINQLFDEAEFAMLRDSCAFRALYEQDMGFDEERQLDRLTQKLESNMKEET